MLRNLNDGRILMTGIRTGRKEEMGIKYVVHGICDSNFESNKDRKSKGTPCPL